MSDRFCSVLSDRSNVISNTDFVSISVVCENPQRRKQAQAARRRSRGKLSKATLDTLFCEEIDVLSTRETGTAQSLRRDYPHDIGRFGIRIFSVREFDVANDTLAHLKLDSKSTNASLQRPTVLTSLETHRLYIYTGSPRNGTKETADKERSNGNPSVQSIEASVNPPPYACEYE